MSKVVAVVAIGGRQGSTAATYLLKEGFSVRGVCRRPEDEKLKQWTEKGVALVCADMMEVDSLKKAFDGVDYIFFTPQLGRFSTPMNDM